MTSFSYERFLNFAINLCGFIALVTPLALWVAWTVPIFWAVLATGCGALLAVSVLVRFLPDP